MCGDWIETFSGLPGRGCFDQVGGSGRAEACHDLSLLGRWSQWDWMQRV